MHKRIVIKLGTSVLTGGTRKLDRAHMVELVRQCAQLHDQGLDVIVVTSGAIAAGRDRLGHPKLPPTVAAKQMLAAVGQSSLMLVWESLFELYNIHVGQLLLTRADVRNRVRFLNARDALHTLLEYRIVPIINENDAVATAEIKVGDNDNLSALVALLAEADLLLILTDLDGLYTADPRTHPDAQLIPEVREIDESVAALAGGSVSGLGTGGMTTKLQAADIARRAGATVVIAAGRAPEVILAAARGDPIGTRFPPLESPLDNRKRWIFGGTTPDGRLIVDAGAARALREKGSSLLPAGVTGVEGDFGRGDTVLIVGPEDRQLARGIARYGADDLRRIAGCRSDQIVDRLGFSAGPVAVHRNDMILL
jgi:glutamate 5-kinase